MPKTIITNNPYVYEKYKNKREVIFKEKLKYIDILEFVRNRIHEGYQLLTHPLSGSVKPNETPYKSIIMSSKKGELDGRGLSIIEDSILTAKKFMLNKTTPNWTESVLDDFKVIDLSLMENTIDKLGH